MILLLLQLQEAEATLRALQEEAHKKDEWIAIFQKSVEDKENTSDEKESDVSFLLLIYFKIKKGCSLI